MPCKANEARRHKIPRARYKVTNWPEYDRALQQRGSLTVWVTPEALAAWQPPRTGQRGCPRDYSDVAIETGHLLRLASGRPWRQTEGLLRSITALLGTDVGVPDHTTFSRRSPGLALATSLAQAQANGPVHVVIDATGLKVHGAGEWLVTKHGERSTRAWRKLHLAVDPDTGELLASELTSNGGRRCIPGRPLACPDPWPPRLGDGGRRLRRRSRLPRRGRAPARSVRGGGHPATLNRGSKPEGKQYAHPARPAHPDDPNQRTPGVAEGGRLRPAVARGNRHVPLQGHHRLPPARPDPARTENRSQGRLLGAEPDDPPQPAGVPPYPLRAP